MPSTTMASTHPTSSPAADSQYQMDLNGHWSQCQQQQQPHPTMNHARMHSSYHVSEGAARYTPTSSFIPPLPSTPAPESSFTTGSSSPLPEDLKGYSSQQRVSLRHPCHQHHDGPVSLRETYTASFYPSPHLSPPASFASKDSACSSGAHQHSSRDYDTYGHDHNKRHYLQNQESQDAYYQQQLQQKQQQQRHSASACTEEFYCSSQGKTLRRTSSASSMSATSPCRSHFVSPGSSVSASSPSPEGQPRKGIDAFGSVEHEPQSPVVMLVATDTLTGSGKCDRSPSQAYPASDDALMPDTRFSSPAIPCNGSNEVSTVPVQGSNRREKGLVCKTKGCRKVFKTLYGRQTHARQHDSHKNKVRHSCTLPGCHVLLDSKRALAVHVQQCKQKKTLTLVSCPEHGCRATFSSTEAQATHRNNHVSGKIDGKLACTWPGCQQILATPKSLKDHLQIHSQRDAGIKLPCPVKGCGKTFGTIRCQRAHELRCKQVKSGDRLPCSIEGCKATFGSSDYVRRHVLDHEKGLIGKSFKCDYAFCTSVLATPLTLQRHKQLHEEQSIGIGWMCLVPGCGKLYSGSKQLTDHQKRQHKDQEPFMFSCPYSECQKEFACQKTAYTHCCLYNKKKCPLKGCTSMLPDEALMEDHLWCHEILKSKPPYPCFEEGCSKVFHDLNAILGHMLSHCIASKTVSNLKSSKPPRVTDNNAEPL